MNNTIWRVLVGAVVTLLLGVTSWTISAVANMPKEYTQKGDFAVLQRENREDHREIIRKMDDILLKMYKVCEEEQNNCEEGD